MAASYSSADMDMLFKYHDDDPKAIISSLLDSLVEGSFQWPARVNTIRSPEHVRILCVVLLPRVPLSQQADVLGVFTQLLDNCRNASICAQVRLIEQLVALVQSPGWHEGASSEHAPPAHARHRRQRMVALLAALGAHHFTQRDLHTIISAFRGTDGGGGGRSRYTTMSLGLVRIMKVNVCLRVQLLVLVQLSV
jgi:hypothetical protein